jgi:hypothetical protein
MQLRSGATTARGVLKVNHKDLHREHQKEIYLIKYRLHLHQGKMKVQMYLQLWHQYQEHLRYTQQEHMWQI